MQKADGEGVRIDIAETAHQILGDIAAREADTVDDRAAGVVLEYGNPLEFRPEAVATRRIREPSLPAVERIVISVANERPYAGIMELFQAVHEPGLSAKTAVGRVVNVAGDQQRINLFGDA